MPPKFDWPALRKHIEFYEKERLRYFPLIWGQKRPVVKWEALQSRAPTFEELAEWFHEGKPTGVAIICGAASNGLVALCFNALDGAIEFFGQKLWDKLLTSTFIVKTLRGVHVYLRSGTPIPTQFVAKGDNRSWLEIRADGNYIAAPPSLHPSSILYEAIGVEKIAKPKNLPNFIEQQLAQLGLKARLVQEAKEKPLELKKVVGRRKKHPPCLESISQGVDEQQREAAALALARHYLIQAYEPEEVFWLLQEWDTKNKPPSYNEPLLEQVVRSAEKYRGLVCSLIKDKPPVFTFCVGEEKCDWPKPKKLGEEPLIQEKEERDKLNEIAVKTLLGKCAFIQHCRKDAATLLEPHWWSMVHVLAVFGDLGREKIHELSRPYQAGAGYTEKETNQKIEEAKKAIEKEIGPHTCTFVEQELGFDCPKDCSAKKLDVKSPAGMAKKLAAQEIHGIYLYKDKSGWHLNIKALIDDLMNEFIFKTIFGLARDDILVYEDGVYNYNGEKVIKQECEVRVGAPVMTTHTVNEVRNHIARLTFTDREKFNTEEYTINLENGLLNVRTKELNPHTPEFLSTIRIPITYDPQAKCPKVQSFLDGILRENDKTVILEFFGYSLIPDYSIPVVLILLGEGANGKTQLLRLLGKFIGKSNYTSVSLQDIENNSFAVSNLEGKLLNIQGDLSSGWLSGVGMLKQLSGQDPIYANRKHRDPIQFDNFARLVFASNKPPIIEEDTLAVWRRILPLDLPNKFEGENDIKQIIDTILTPQELSGLLNLALEELRQLLDKGDFSYQGSYSDRSRHYTIASDPARVFVEERCNVGSGFKILKSELYEAYVLFCDENRVQLSGEAQFGKELRQVPGLSISDKQYQEMGVRVRWWLNITLKPPEPEPEPESKSEGIDMEV